MFTRFHFAPDDGPGGQGGGNDDGDPNPDPVEPPEGNGDDEQELVPRTELSKVNREAAKYRRERNDLQNRLKAIEDAEKTDNERLTGEVQTLSDKLAKSEKRERALRVEVMAGRIGIAPDARPDAFKLLDWDSIEDPNSDQEVEDALKALVKERPYLRGGTSSADGGAGGDGRTVAAGMNDQLRRLAGRR